MTEDIRRLRGDWLLEALTAIARGQAKWMPIPTKPLGMTGGTPGRFHTPSQTYWPEAREDSGAAPPQVMYVRIPGEEDLDYPGERVTLTPTWVRQAHAEIVRAGCYQAWDDYVKGDASRSVFYYHARKRKVVGGPQPPEVKTAALILSDLMDYAPVPDNPLVPARELAEHTG